MSDPSSLMLVEQTDAILRIQFNRPQKKNALSIEMYDAFREALIHADENPEIRTIFITGSADSFSAGNDLNSFLQNPNSQAAAHFIKQLSVTKTPIVAAVNGLAVGVGVTMLLHCDLVYAADTAVFNFAFIDLGVVPEAGASYLLPRLIGQRKAAELLMLGEKFDAHTAIQIGLVNQIYPEDALIDVGWDKAVRLSQKPPIALTQTKALLKRGVESTLAETIDYELQLFHERVQSDEAREIMQAILLRKRS